MASTTHTSNPKPDVAFAMGAEALFALLHIQTNVVRPIDDAFDAAHGTGISGFELLARLSRMHPDGASVRYLSEQVVVSPSRVSRLADEFVGRGWLERAVSPQDGRLSLVRLTASGRAALAAMEQTFAQALQTHFLDHLSQEQLASLIAVGNTLGAPHC
jgi:DNA-binding MarR family transcriptional regulator